MAQTNKGLPKGIGKVMKGRGQLPSEAYVNFMDSSNKVFLGESFSSRTHLLKGDPNKLSI
jgi:hypothetical protein